MQEMALFENVTGWGGTQHAMENVSIESTFQDCMACVGNIENNLLIYPFSGWLLNALHTVKRTPHFHEWRLSIASEHIASIIEHPNGYTQISATTFSNA